MTEKSYRTDSADQKSELIEALRRGIVSQEEESTAFRSRFSLDTPEGRQLYESCSDDMLLGMLRDAAKQLGRSPAQGEVHWALRSYLRARFQNWPTALRLAGLSRTAGRGAPSLEQVHQSEADRLHALDLVRQRASALGRMPHPTDLPDVCQNLKRYYQTWSEVLHASGAEQAAVDSLRQIEDLEPEYRSMLAQIRALAETLNRAPLRSEVDERLRTAVVQRCGSWRSALFQIGLEPVRHINPFVDTPLKQRKGRSAALHQDVLQGCHYRLLHLDAQTQADLELVKTRTAQLGHTPGRREIAPEVRQRLQAACGSWSNALFQLHLHTAPKNRR